MKIYICINQKSIPGYLHVDPDPVDNVPAFNGSILDICQIAGQGECEEILAPELLNYIPQSALDQSLQHLISLLHHEGTLIIGGVEYYELCRAAFLNIISNEQFNNLVFESKMKVNAIYKIETIKQKLQNFGLKITNIRLNNGNFIIEAKRA